MKALLTDLDRTLTGPELRLDPRVPPVIRKLRAAGVEVAIVTGRPLEYVLASPLGELASVVVAENGALLHHEGRTRMTDREHATFRHRVCEALGPLAETFLWSRVMGSGPRKAAKEAGRLLAAADVGCELCYNAEEVMLLPGGVHKGLGARVALEALGVAPMDAAAVGDGDNDVPLLRAVGRGYAVANASLAARAAADHVLPGAYADGFVELAASLVAEARRKVTP